MRRSLLTVALLPALLLPACSSDAARDDTGAVTEADEVSVNKLRVGDCLQTPADGVVTDIKAVPCTQAHDGEIYHSVELPEGDYPGTTAIQAKGDSECTKAFATYIGTTFDDSELDLSPLTPIEAGWKAGDREIVCIVQDSKGGLTTSLKGTKR